MLLSPQRVSASNFVEGQEQEVWESSILAPGCCILVGQVFLVQVATQLVFSFAVKRSRLEQNMLISPSPEELGNLGERTAEFPGKEGLHGKTG